ncbi:MAG TPA: histidine kinase dimerization/phosphoacceptor domain -containing protein [Spirochaetia bacterium]|nr:histidine kinase dimerization/phosphoacceptor domain -containing protein [Spirochaetia bacterium]
MPGFKNNCDVLVVDNSPLMIEFFTEVVTSAGCRLRTAVNGLEALQRIRERAPDILFTDIVMPYVDGIRLTRILRAREEHASIYIIAVSAIARESPRNLAELGFDLCIAKGPLREMRPHVVAAIEAARGENPPRAQDGVLGLDAVHERQITRELLAELRQAEAMADHLVDGVVTVSADGILINLNRAARELLSVTEEGTVGRPFASLELEKVADQGQVPEQFVGPDRGTLYAKGDRVLSCAQVPLRDPDRDTVVWVLRDVTELSRSRKRLQAALDEKELLLREIHHRVKNNLTTITSLINLQARDMPDDASRLVLEHLRSQIASIGLVHEKIYQSRSVSGVQFGEYARDLLESIVQMHDRRSSITVRVQAEAATFDVRSAIPLGLLLTELAINTLKHGYPDLKNGTIDVQLKRGAEGAWLLDYRDDGVGSPVSRGPVQPTPGSKETMGTRLIAGLAVQLRGELSYPESNHRHVLVVFEGSANRPDA